MRINYGLVNTDSSPVPQRWAMSPAGAWHVLHHPSPLASREWGGDGQGWAGTGGEVGHHGEEIKVWGGIWAGLGYVLGWGTEWDTGWDGMG